MQTIPGMGKSLEEYHLEMIDIDPRYRAKEATAQKRRWFDYRLMHPVEATYLWIYLYNDQSRKFTTTCWGEDRLNDASLLAAEGALVSREGTSIWRARFVCDSIGCPYDQALSFLARRAINRGYQTFIRPNQLSAPDAAVDLYLWWREKVQTILTFSTHPFYQAELWSDHPDQLAHMQFIKGQIDKRLTPGLVQRLFKEGLLNIDLARRFFPQFADQAYEDFCSPIK